MDYSPTGKVTIYDQGAIPHILFASTNPV